MRFSAATLLAFGALSAANPIISGRQLESQAETVQKLTVQVQSYTANISEIP